MENPIKKKIVKKLLTGLILCFLVASLVSPVFLFPKEAKAGFPANVLGDVVQTLKNVWDKLYQTYEKTEAIRGQALKEAAWTAFQSALSGFLNQIAYETANWLGSGGEGQKPAFMTGEWEGYLSDAGGVFVGSFVETFGEEMGKGMDQCETKCDDKADSCWEACEGDACTDCDIEWDDCFAQCEEEDAGWSEGNFAERTAKQISKFICRPDLDISAQITLNLPTVRPPKKPDCNLKSIRDNWEKEINSFDFAKKAAGLFDPRQHDMGAAMYEWGAVFASKAEGERVAEKERGTRTEGTQPPKHSISGEKKSPEDVASEAAKKAAPDSKAEEQQAPEGVFSSAFAVFTNTLFSKAMETIVSKGLAALGQVGQDPQKGTKEAEEAAEKIAKTGSGGLYGMGEESLYEEEASPAYGGREATRLAFADLLKVDMKSGGVKDILAELVTCPDRSKPGPTNCVVDNDLAEAIRQGLTVQQAIDDGDIKGDAVFGYDSFGIEPAYDEGYPYRSIVILRKYRVAPVGWEIAAQFIKNFHGEKESFNSLIEAYDNPTSQFYGLVDPNWVLKIPEVVCNRQGYGFEVLEYQSATGYDQDGNGSFDDVAPIVDATSGAEMPGDTPPSLHALREDNYCADEQSCIYEDNSGDCLSYGYCLAEKRTWNLDTPMCQDYFNTCQTFTGEGEPTSYLENTLDWGNCNIDNAGCAWYCQDYDPITDNWTCVRAEEIWSSCDTAPYCTVHEDPADTTSDSCEIPFGGTECILPSCSQLPNLISNPSFEDGDAADATDWTEGSVGVFHEHTRIIRDAHDGDYVLRSYALASADTVTSYSAPITGVDMNKEYVFSFWVYNDLVDGRSTISILDGVLGTHISGVDCDYGPGSYVEVQAGWDQGVWVKKTCQIDPDYGSDTWPASGGFVHIVTGTTTTQSGTIYFDDFELKEKCSGTEKKLHIGVEAKEDAEIYLDNDAQECEAQFAGCSEFISLAGDPINYLSNGNFEEFEGTIGDDVVDTFPGWQVTSGTGIEAVSTAYNGLVGAEIEGEAQVIVDTGAPLANRIFSLSFQARDGSTSCDGEFWVSDWEHGELFGGDSWNLHEAVFMFPADRLVNEFDLFFNTGSNSCVIDTVLIEETEEPGKFREYGAVGQIYINKPPDYFACRGYTALSEEGEPDQATCEATTVDLTSFYDRREECDRAGYAWDSLAYLCIGRKHWREDIKRCVLSGHEECDNYSYYCSEEDVGCDLYTPFDYGDSVVGKTAPEDYCPAECVGYETYKQSANTFEDETFKYFISDTAQTCSAVNVGCSEFTNLDVLEAGGEQRQYYSYVRQCVKPSDSRCTTFYSWEGDDQTGFQLGTYDFVESDIDYNNNGVTTDDGPRMTDDAVSTIDCRSFYGLKPYQQGYDSEITPDCREIYDSSGNIFYRRISRTISCSDECQALRWNVTSEAVAVNQANCNNHNGEWVDLDEDGLEESCIYWIIPSQAVICPATENGCREYIGNAGHNWYIVASDDFEDATARDWTGVPVMPEASTEAVSVGDHSLKVPAPSPPATHTISKKINGTCQFDPSNPCTEPEGCACEDTALSPAAYDSDAATPQSADCWINEDDHSCSYRETMKEGQSYIISFWAKAETPSLSTTDDIGVYLISDTTTIKSIITDLPITNEWQSYVLGPITIEEGELYGFEDHLTLVLDNMNYETYFDDIIIKEIQQNVYAKLNSWQTPNSCDNAIGDIYGQACGGSSLNPLRCDGPDETDPTRTPAMAGCRAYADSAGTTHTLVSFSKLCQEEVAGCQTLIDTKNYDSPFDETYNYGDSSAIYIPEDEFVYMVVDPEKVCPDTSKGCRRLGRPILDQADQAEEMADIYLVDDPDQYDEIMCLADESGCKTYQADASKVFFKDPGEKVCIYEEASGNKEEGWYKKDSTAEQPDCPSLVDPRYRTVGDGHGVKQPVGECIGGYSAYPNDYCFADSDCIGPYAYCSHWTGLCPLQESGCTEFIDPVSEYNNNVVYNPSFRSDIDDDQDPDGWREDLEGQEYNQSVKLYRNTLYTIGLKGPVDSEAELEIVCDQYEIYSPDQSAGIVYSGSDYSARVIKPLGTESALMRIYNTYNDYCRIYFSEADSPHGFMNPPSTDAAYDPIYTSNNGEVIIRRSTVNYNIENGVDYTACNSIKNIKEGCVMLNRRQAAGTKEYERLIFSSYLTDDIEVPHVCGEDEICDSNVLVKATPDRACDQWLFCENYEQRTDETGQVSSYCVDLGVCNSLNKEMECNSFVFSDEREEQVFDSASVGQIGTLSGYGQAGYRWGPNTSIAGRYPLDYVMERGSVVHEFNGSFETVDSKTDPNTLPTGWQIGPKQKSPGDGFAVVDDPVEAQRCEYINGKGECLENYVPPDGRNFLRVDSSFEAFIGKNNLIRVEPSTTYVISGQVNTIKLGAENGLAVGVIGYKEYKEDGAELLQADGSTFAVGGDYVPAGRGWTGLNYSFTTQEETNSIALVLKAMVYDQVSTFVDCSAAGVNCAGKTYFDNIEVMPALEIADNEYVSRSCRMYAQNDSLSCSYMDESGLRYRGWYGYCLETDPNNDNYCLQWWPLDIIRGGDPIEDEGLKLAGPMYYCLHVDYDEQGADKEAPLLPVGLFEVGIAMESSVELGLISDAWFYGHQRDYNDKRYNIEEFGSRGVLNCAGFNGDPGNAYGQICTIMGGILGPLTGDAPWCPYKVPGWSPKGGTCDGFGKCTDAMDMVQTVLQGLFAYGPGSIEDMISWLFEGVPLPEIAASTSYLDYTPYYRWRIDQSGAFLDIIAYKRKYEPGAGTGACPDGCEQDPWSTHGTCSEDSSYNQIYFGKRAPFCTTIVQTVQPMGSNKAWASRVAPGSEYTIEDYDYGYDQDYYPFGAIMPPKQNSGNPEKWDRLYYLDDRALLIEHHPEAENTFDKVEIYKPPADHPRAGAPYGCDGSSLTNYREDTITMLAAEMELSLTGVFGQDELTCYMMQDDRFVDEPNFSKEAINRGSFYAADRLKKVFAENYAWYEWNDGGFFHEGGYELVEGTSFAWDPPASMCDSRTRDETNDWCAVPPWIRNIKVNQKQDNIILDGYGNVALSFNMLIDQDQLPMKRVVVDWGDGTQTDLSNLSMLDRPDFNDPLTLTHHYYYKTFFIDDDGDGISDLYPGAYKPSVGAAPDYEADCMIDGLYQGRGCFKFLPRIKVYDNWGWCSGDGGSLDGHYGTACLTAQGDWEDGDQDGDGYRMDQWTPFGDYETPEQWRVYVLEP